MAEYRILTIAVNRDDPDDIRVDSGDWGMWELDGLFKHVLELEAEVEFADSDGGDDD